MIKLPTIRFTWPQIALFGGLTLGVAIFLPAFLYFKPVEVFTTLLDGSQCMVRHQRAGTPLPSQQEYQAAAQRCVDEATIRK